MKKEKTFISIALIVLIVGISLACCGSGEKTVIVSEEEQRIEYLGVEEYEVGPFETLSHIAVKYIPSDEYMSQWISDVKRLNGRKKSDIYVGEVIKVYVCK